MAKLLGRLGKLNLPQTNFWQNKKVLITGHTGFKGGWLTLWLSQLGAKIHGLSLAPPSQPNLFEVANIRSVLSSHTIGDIRDLNLVTECLLNVQPEIIFHLAAQPLVLKSYQEPLDTYSINILGTLNLFEAARITKSVMSFINITSDKCYENREPYGAHVEGDPMGGADPYSSSKACSELITTAYRKSFFNKAGIGLASVRAGNVIGGGDWAKDRLIPDFLRTIYTNVPLKVRSPNSIRPWQHVLEPIAGYLLLAEKLYQNKIDFADAWNFGPQQENAKSVSWVLDCLQKKVPATKWEIEPQPDLFESKFLMLNSSKSQKRLGWQTRWNLEQAIDKTIDFHLRYLTGEQMQSFAFSQILEYENSQPQ